MGDRKKREVESKGEEGKRRTWQGKKGLKDAGKVMVKEEEGRDERKEEIRGDEARRVREEGK